MAPITNRGVAMAAVGALAIVLISVSGGSSSHLGSHATAVRARATRGLGIRRNSLKSRVSSGRARTFARPTEDQMVERLKGIAARDLEKKRREEEEEAEYQASLTGVEKVLDKGLEKVDKALGDDDKDGSGAGGFGALLGLGVVLFYLSGSNPYSVKTEAPKLNFNQGARPELTLKEREGLKELLRQYERRRTSAPGDTEALEASAVLYTKLGNFDQAAPLLTSLAEKKPQDPSVWRVKAEVEFELDEYDACEKSYLKAISLAPGEIDNWEGYLNLLTSEDDFEGALEALKKADKLLPQDRGLLKAGVYAQWDGHTVDAEEAYDSLIDNFPEDYRVYFAKGAWLNKQERYNEANKVRAASSDIFGNFRRFFRAMEFIHSPWM